MALPLSGLPETVADGEDIARFLTQSSHFTKRQVDPSAFLPSRKDRGTSVSRHGREPLATMCSLGFAAAGDRKLYGAAIIKARDVRGALLEITSHEPPKRHAVICGWPWDENDPVQQKAQQKERALVLVGAAGEPLLFNEGQAWTSG
jgi:hypothetical protein